MTRPNTRGAKTEKRAPATEPTEPRVDVGRTSILISPASRYPLSFALQNWPSPRNPLQDWPGLPKG